MRVRMASLRHSWVISIFLLVPAFGSLSTQAAQTGSIVGWGGQVVGADTSAGFTAIAAGYGHSGLPVPN